MTYTSYCGALKYLFLYFKIKHLSWGVSHYTNASFSLIKTNEFSNNSIFVFAQRNCEQMGNKDFVLVTKQHLLSANR